MEEKKTIPATRVLRHRELAQKISTLTEDIEELKSEKALPLNQLNCADDYGMGEIKQHIASMESSLGTLNQQEKKYSAELDAALVQHTELQQQAADMDAMELDTVRHAIQSGKERKTAQRLQAAHGKKFDSGMLTQSRMDVAEMVGKTTEPVSIRQSLKPLPGQQNSQSHKIEHSRER